MYEYLSTLGFKFIHDNKNGPCAFTRHIQLVIQQEYKFLLCLHLYYENECKMKIVKRSYLGYVVVTGSYSI